MRVNENLRLRNLTAIAFLTFASCAAILSGCRGHAAASSPDPTPLVTIPQEALPSPNAFDYDIKAAAALKDKLKISEALLPPGSPYSGPGAGTYTVAQKEQLVLENAETLRLLRAGFAYRYECPQPGSKLPPFYSNFLSIADLLKIEGQVREARGNWGAAVDCDLDAIRLGEDIPHGATEMDWVLGVVCQGTGRRPIWAAEAHLSAAQDKAAAKRLETVEATRTPFVSVMQQEEWTGQASLLAAFQKPNWRKSIVDDAFADYGIIDSEASRSVHALVTEGLDDATKRSVFDTYTRYRDEFIASARAPYAAHISIKRVPLAPNDIVAFFAFHYDPYKSVQFSDAANQTQNALLMTDLAVHAYAIEHSRPPNSLSDLVPRYLNKVPQDPFAMSGPLRYRLTEDKYVLYSVGPDDRDDHGTAIFDATKPAPTPQKSVDDRYIINETSKGDVVAGVNRFNGPIQQPLK